MAAVEKSFWKELVDDNFKVDIIDIGAAEGDEWEEDQERHLGSANTEAPGTGRLPWALGIGRLLLHLNLFFQLLYAN